MHSELRRLGYRIVVLTLPLLFTVAEYVALDPFSVLRRPVDVGPLTRPIPLNWDVAATELFLQNYPEERYDSFIFGSSRSLAFLCADWGKHINSTRVYHFHASAETLYGLWTKIKFLDRRGVALRNALIVVDESLLQETTNSTGAPFIKDPKVSGESIIAFHATFFSAFISNALSLKYLALFIPPLQKYVRNMFEGNRFARLPDTGDIIFEKDERDLAQLGPRYWEVNSDRFKPAYPNVGDPVISSKQVQMLLDIECILTRQHTDYRVVVSPLFDRVGLNPADRRSLESIFGQKFVADYSGANAITLDIRNYYDYSHYRPHVARAILEKLYEN